MALHNIKIVVVDGGKSGSYKAKSVTTEKQDDNEKSKKGKNSPLYKILNLKKTLKKKAESAISPAGVMAVEMGVEIAGQLIKESANYYVSDVGRKSGDSNYQQLINRQVEIVTDVTGVLGCTLAGAATGSMFGPVGAVVGAVAGLASSSISLAFRQAERQRAYNHELFKDSNSQTYNLARTSYQGFTGRLR